MSSETTPGARCVWDFTTGDGRRFCDRLALIIDTAGEFQKRGVKIDFVLLLHGGATQFGARTLVGTKFDKPDAADLAPAHQLLRRFAGMGGRIIVCGIAMERSEISENNVIAGASIERNVFVTSVELQNRGYAYMPIA
jgi:intracellular sulfur oxidation DsrE/DsrF family protein